MLANLGEHTMIILYEKRARTTTEKTLIDGAMGVGADCHLRPRRSARSLRSVGGSRQAAELL